MYKLIKNALTNQVNVIERLFDHVFIPFDPDNTDYQEYLRWLELGNTPLPTDEGA